jgi:ATP-dependent Lhr-like helicase
LGKIEILSQSVDGTILLGPAGEHIVNHFSFYAAFATPEEWRLVAAGQALGTLPIDFPLSPGVFLIFGGRRWRVQNVDTEHRVVDLAPAPAGRPPRFAGTGATIHDRVRQEMLRVYQATDIPAYADATAAGLLKEARQNFTRCQLDTTQLLASGDSTYLFLWAGDRVVNTATAILAAYGHAPTGEGLAISVANTTPLELAAQLIVMLTGPAPDATDLAATVRNKTAEKYDGLLPETLLDQAFAARSLDVPGAWAALRAVTEPI